MTVRFILLKLSLEKSKQELLRARDWSGNTAKAGGIGAQGAAERPAEATARDHEPHSPRLRSCNGKPDGERSEPGRPKKFKLINF